MVGFEGEYGGCRGGGMSFQLMTAAGACLFSATSHACSTTSFIEIRGHVAINNCCLYYQLNRLAEKAIDT